MYVNVASAVSKDTDVFNKHFPYGHFIALLIRSLPFNLALSILCSSHIVHMEFVSFVF
jgi:hypothetical protein